MPVNTPRAEYSAALAQWDRCRDVAAGQDSVKAKGQAYLPPISPLQAPAEYEAYKTRAMFYNGMGRTIQGLVGAIVRKPPSVVAPTAIMPHFEDVTLSGVGLHGFAASLLEDVLKVGRYGVLVDLPEDGPGTARPYWVPYLAHQILNWRTAMIGGAAILTRLVLSESVDVDDSQDPFAVKKVGQCRVLELVPVSGGLACVVTLYRQEATGAQTWIITKGPIPLRRRGAPVPYIPFVFCGPLDTTPDIDKPPLLDLADVNLSHYRTSADLEHGRHFTALPTAWVTGYSAPGDPLRIGAGTAWIFPHADTRVGMLEFTGAGLGALETAMVEKQALMAVLGARLLEAQKADAEAAATVRLRHAGDDAVLQSIANAASAALTKLVRMHCWWAGLDVEDAQATVTLNTDFFAVPMPAQDVQAAMLAVQAGKMSFDTFYYLLQKGEWTRPGVDAQTERDAIAADEAGASAAVGAEPAGPAGAPADAAQAAADAAIAAMMGAGQ